MKITILNSKLGRNLKDCFFFQERNKEKEQINKEKKLNNHYHFFKVGNMNLRKI